jgi:hypothetical protein
LYAAQRFGACGIAGQYYQRASLGEEPLNRLPGVFINGFKTSGTIRRTGIITQVNIVVLRQQGFYFPENGKAAVTAIEYADGRFNIEYFY